MRIAQALSLSAVALALGACATPCPPPATQAPVSTRFTCENDVAFTAHFSADRNEARIVQTGYPDAALRAQSAGSGFRYAAEGVELRGRAAEARLTRPGAGEVRCRAEGMTGALPHPRSASVQAGAVRPATQTCGAAPYAALRLLDQEESAS